MSEAVKSMFADISSNYDRMNGVISLGMHHKWRKNLVSLSGAKKGQRVLDCASGTGDLAIEFKRAVGSEGYVIATDFCREMLDILPQKAEKLQLEIPIEIADIMNLQYPDDSFDYVGVSFGIRNVDDPKIGLKEMARVVKSGGKVMILETGKPKGFMRSLYEVFNKIVPTLGALLAGKKAAYTYLPNSISKFPYGDDFLELMQSTRKFSSVKAYPQFFGVVYIYEGVVR